MISQNKTLVSISVIRVREEEFIHEILKEIKRE